MEQENISNRDTVVKQMLKSISKLDSTQQIVKSEKEEQDSPGKAKFKNMDFLFIKRLLYIKHELDENMGDSGDIYGQSDFPRPKTPKSVLAGRK